jgi:diguanylate cyclase (GGDEF)-like protein
MCRLDADHFKKVNDEHGHATGDRVLVAIARATESVMRSNDVLARVGGEEFDVLLPDTDVQGAAQLAERIRSAIAAVVVTSDRGERVSPRVSVGVAAHREGDDLESMLRRADDALYRAKQAGRDRTVVS